MANKTVVRIFGHEYTVIGDKSEEEIISIANHVDEQMKYIANYVDDKSAVSVAVLSSVNITEEYFEALKRITKIADEREKLLKERDYYKNLLEESKKTSVKSMDSIEEMKANIKDANERMRKLSEKCSEYENSFFDLQMENIRLKSELEKLKLQNR